jgi:hypothetical protein
VVTELETLVRDADLPFTVRAVMIAPREGRPPIFVPPRPRFTDLHQFHHLLRHDLVKRLDETQQFGATVRQRVEEAVRTNVIVDAPDQNEGIQVRARTTELSESVAARASSARTALARPYAEYRAQPLQWQRDVGDAMSVAGELKTAVSPVARTDFLTPIDNLVGTLHVNWLPWLDEILKQRDVQAEQRLLYSAFATKHPALEHLGGVARGGTFVILYTTAGTVWGDLALPYYLDADEDELVEPALPDPGIRPPRVVHGGLTVVPSRKTFFDKQWTVARPQLELAVDAKIGAQRAVLDTFRESYVNVFRDSLDIVKNAPRGPVRPNAFADPLLDALVEDNRAKIGKVDQLRRTIEREDVLPEVKAVLRVQLDAAEEELARNVHETTEYVAKGRIAVDVGSEGERAIHQVTGTLGRIGNQQVVTGATRRLEEIRADAKNAQLDRALGGVLKKPHG